MAKAYFNVNYIKFIDYDKTTDEKLYNTPICLSTNPFYGEWTPNLFTNGGRDLLHKAGYIDESATERGFGCMGLTESTVTPAVTDTVLTGEIASGGLGRKETGTKTHTNGTNTSTLEHTFTADIAHSTGVKAGALFNALSGGTMAHIFTFTSQTLAINDQLRVTSVVTLS